ncbi:hypothetical protein [Candidatus Poriferisodalis sp.]|uniref:hypothetical protein n=1 Tax=Candidatus Poriferisodalis sp. TaxID=3101277 RepID=UPI003B02AA34
MRARAARITDISDVRILMDVTGIRTVKNIDALVGEVFPGEALHERQRGWLGDVIADTTRIQHPGGEPRCL